MMHFVEFVKGFRLVEAFMSPVKDEVVQEEQELCMAKEFQ